ncbi:Transcriptional regulator, TetR family [Candidatus Phaeomarinobacter ectocarpi]|uniref:Transcriptional regulator, TetR family n=2 Tax=Candidatus Phaeomarinibacter ectocarpi TaxID=1458461 RepID=X5M6Q8_9HYPH|nr:Transcriptional regulator, TetR family [Candidatus Phaeomarinobacter ectocarpi]
MNAFWLRGYGHTSLPDLVSATGLLRGSLYAAYGDKEGMFAVAIDSYLAHLRAELASDAKGIEGIREMLDAVVRITADDPDRRGCLLINAIPETGFVGAANAEAVNAGLQEMHRRVRKRLAEAQAASSQMPDLDELVAMVFASAVSIRVLGRAGQSRVLLQQVADGAVTSLRQAFDPGS